MKDSTKKIIESTKEFDFFDAFNVDMETYELFKYKFDMKFNSRKQPDIYYRNFLIIGLYKNFESVSIIGRLLDLEHCSVIHIVRKTSEFIKNNDKQILEIFEQVKFFFERYGKHKVYKQIAGSSENEFISSITLERQFAIRQAI